MSDTRLWLWLDEQKSGPFSLHQIRAMLGEGQIAWASLASANDGAVWEPLEFFRGIISPREIMAETTTKPLGDVPPAFVVAEKIIAHPLITLGTVLVIVGLPTIAFAICADNFVQQGESPIFNLGKANQHLLLCIAGAAALIGGTLLACLGVLLDMLRELRRQK